MLANEKAVEMVDSGEKVIRLHTKVSGELLISNNGPPIPIQDKKKIFKLGFSRISSILSKVA